MSRRSRVLILSAVAVGVVLALVLRHNALSEGAPRAAVTTGSDHAVATRAPIKRPKLVELGAARCQSCKMMKEELTQLGVECPDTLEIEMIDVWQDEASAKRYGVEVIPTQVFLDADGHELSRHIGFIPRAEILARFASTGARCDSPTPPGQPGVPR